MPRQQDGLDRKNRQSRRPTYGFVSLLHSAPTSQVGVERDCIVVLGIARREKERHPAPPDGASKRRDCAIFRIELTRISASELGPPGRVVIEPTAQGGARREILQPEVDPRVRFGDAARPQAVYQDPQAIIVRRLLVGALHFDLFYECHRANNIPRSVVSRKLRSIDSL